MSNRTKNDIAWKKLFEQHNILEYIEKNSFFEITASQINQVRESRLMAKFDHYVNLPHVFRKNNLSILPVSRSKYVIGKFKTHHQVNYDKNLVKNSVNFPTNIETIDYINLSSESAALSCAFHTGIIDELIGEKTIFTVSGRMSSSKFSFTINHSNNLEPYNIIVENSQCEIDGGFESNNYFLLIEAKNHHLEDFLVRQIYYPYRLWRSKITKKVVPILMTYSGDIFSFFIYEFTQENAYNSLSIIKQKNYIIAPEEITKKNIVEVFNTVKIVEEKTNIPFPQADRFERVIDLLSQLANHPLTKEEITQNYQFDTRQTGYYTDGGTYLGLIDKYYNNDTQEVTFFLTEEGLKIVKKRHKSKILFLVQKILEHKVFYETFALTVKTGQVPSNEIIKNIMNQSNLLTQISDSTKQRRTSTVKRWITWILKQYSPIQLTIF